MEGGVGEAARMVVRLAMWSGPRTVSTALMRSFGSRSDAVVCDEPFYAHYLPHTGLDHPLAAEIRARHETDWRRVVAGLIAPLPAGKTLFYQKHMAHHLLPHVGREWMGECAHAFLIRDPEEMLASLLLKLRVVRLEDTGLPQQVELFAVERERTGRAPAVLDSRDLVEDPERHLRALCAAVGIEFQPAMLSWAPGSRETDGCWGECWYGNTLASTGFQPYPRTLGGVPPECAELLDAMRELHAGLHAARLRPPETPCSRSTTNGTATSSSTSTAS
ncbi:MAG: HAD family hydrolase [Planctomycetota bacterium]